MTNRPYFTLLVRDNANSDWVIEFGDYDRKAVEFERNDYRDGYRDYRASNLKIIRTANADQSTINAAVDACNGRNSDLVEVPVRD